VIPAVLGLIVLAVGFVFLIWIVSMFASRK